MQSIVSKGENVQEAIRIGLSIMEVSKDQVNVEIIKNESRGLMGIGRRKAVVKLEKNHLGDANKKSASIDSYDTIEELVESLPSDDSIQQPRSESTSQKGSNVGMEGKVWVSNNKIYVKDSPAKYPTVTIKKDIKLFKNGSPVKGETILVTEKDSLTVQLDEEIKETKWKITTDSKKLTAMLEVIPGYKITRKLKDVSPCEYLELVIEESKEINNTFNYDEVLFKLDAMQITYGINHSEIMNAIKSTEEKKFEIATGQKAEQGMNGFIKLKVDLDTKTVLTEDETGKVNFRESIIIPTVEQGEILGEVIPPIPGKQGITITNVVIPPKPVFPMKIKAEKGVFMIENNLVAIESGRPSIQIRGQLVKASIMPKLVHEGNVNISTGNIRFDGDIEILGEVEENMLVESGGDIIVYKSVNDSTITASNSIVTYGNVASSVLTAGKNNMVIVEQGKALEKMHYHLERMITVINQLRTTPAFKSSDFARGGLQPLIRILLEKKFNEFFILAKKYVEISKRDREFLDDDMKAVSNSVNQFFLVLSNAIKSIEQLKTLSQKMKEIYELSKTPIEPDSYLTISNALNSSLYCSGNILIIGQGSVNTKIYTGGKLKITGSLRGGEVFGKLGVELNEVGSISGTETIIEVPADKSIQINHAFEGTRIRIGNERYTLVEAKQNIFAQLNKEGQITFE